MSERYPGGIISKTAPVPTGPYENGTAPGVWTLDQQAAYTKQGIWPTAGLTPNYIEDVFQTWLYTGNGSTQTITNGIDLAGKGGLVWSKRRSTAESHVLLDTARNNGSSALYSDATSGQQTAGNFIQSFNSNGYSIGSNSLFNASGSTNVSWTFRKQPKFFDVVTFTTNSSGGATINHSLGSTPGMVITKATSTGWGWGVWHRGLASTSHYMELQTTNAQNSAGTPWIVPGETSITFPNDTAMLPGSAQCVAYIFAHNAGGFGLTGTDNVISCGSFTTDGSANATVDLGFEPQWVMAKRSSGTGGWCIQDNMRGFTAKPTSYPANPILFANSSDAEITGGANTLQMTATGFTTDNVSYNANSTYIYIAIRRGPMKVPTDGTKVFIPVTATPSGATTVTTNFPVDLAINAQRDAGTSGNKVFWDRLRGSSTAAGQGLFSNLTNAEVSYSGNGIGLQSNTTIVDNYWNTLNGATTPVIYWNFRRAPSFFDEVCYTGNGSTQTITHNLTVVPELIIAKNRGQAGNNWPVLFNFASTTMNYGFLNLTNSCPNDTYANVGVFSAAPTSTSMFLTNSSSMNASGFGIVAYLFATCAGVSKVGSYTGTATTLQINCGFTAGARFVLIKRTDSTGDWYVWDSARGIVAGNDPYLLLNSTAAEVTSTDYVDTYSAGFEITSTAPAAINASGGSYIFLAIA